MALASWSGILIAVLGLMATPLRAQAPQTLPPPPCIRRVWLYNAGAEVRLVQLQEDQIIDLDAPGYSNGLAIDVRFEDVTTDAVTSVRFSLFDVDPTTQAATAVAGSEWLEQAAPWVYRGNGGTDYNPMTQYLETGHSYRLAITVLSGNILVDGPCLATIRFSVVQNGVPLSPPPTPSPTPLPTPCPTLSPTPSPTGSPTRFPTPLPTPSPTLSTPACTQAEICSAISDENCHIVDTREICPILCNVCQTDPSTSSSRSPSEAPSVSTAAPTVATTLPPPTTAAPTQDPTPTLTVSPTPGPIVSLPPTVSPTWTSPHPTSSPSTAAPTPVQPSVEPTGAPVTARPSSAPTDVGMDAPTRAPTETSAPPTAMPTLHTTVDLTRPPLPAPTLGPAAATGPGITTNSPTGSDGTEQGTEPDSDGGGGGGEDGMSAATSTALIVASVVLVLLLLLLLIGAVHQRRSRKRNVVGSSRGPDTVTDTTLAGDSGRFRVGSVQGHLYTDIDDDPVARPTQSGSIPSPEISATAPGIFANDPNLYSARAEPAAMEMSQMGNNAAISILTPNPTLADPVQYATVSDGRVLSVLNEETAWPSGDAAVGRSTARAIDPCQHDYAKAIYDYVPAESTQLGLSEGDIVLVSAQGDDGWWTGSRKEAPSVVGIFPGSYVELVDEATAPQNVADTAGNARGYATALDVNTSARRAAVVSAEAPMSSSCAELTSKSKPENPVDGDEVPDEVQYAEVLLPISATPATPMQMSTAGIANDVQTENADAVLYAKLADGGKRPAATVRNLGQAPGGESESDDNVLSLPRQHPRGYGVPQDRAPGNSAEKSEGGTAGGNEATVSGQGHYATATDAKTALASAARHAYGNAIEGEDGGVGDPLPESAYSTALPRLHSPPGAPAALPGHDYEYDRRRAGGSPGGGLDHGKDGYADPHDALITASMIGHDYRAVARQPPAAPGGDRGEDDGYAVAQGAVVKAPTIGHDYRAVARDPSGPHGLDLEYEEVPQITRRTTAAAENLYADVADDQAGGASTAASAGPTIIYDKLGGDGPTTAAPSLDPPVDATYSVVNKRR